MTYQGNGVTRRVIPDDEPDNKPEPIKEQPKQNKTFQELSTQDGEAVVGINKVMLQGVIAYQQLKQTSNRNLRLTAKVYVPFESKGERKRFGYSIHAWGELAEILDRLEPGTPVRITGKLNVFSWTDQTGQKLSKMDVEVNEVIEL